MPAKDIINWELFWLALLLLLHFKILVGEGWRIGNFDDIKFVISSVMAVVASVGEQDKATFE
jgi:hypothetical protein